MGTKLYNVAVAPLDPPKAVFLKHRKKPTKTGKRFTNLTGRIRGLVIERAPGQQGKSAIECQHLLRRVDSGGKTVWVTAHPSLEETFWHAEWEFDVPRARWQKVDPVPSTGTKTKT